MTIKMIIFISYILLFFGFGVIGMCKARDNGTNWSIIIMVFGFIFSPILASYCL